MNEEMMEKLVASAKQVEEKVAGIEKTLSESKEGNADLQKQLKELSEKQLELGKKFVSLSQQKIEKSEGSVRMTLGARLVGSPQYADLMAGKVSKLVLSSDSGTPAAIAPVDTPAGAVQPDYQGLRGEPQLPATVVAAFTHLATSSDAISYLKEKSFTNSAAEVAAGALKPESTISFEEATAPVRTIAHFIRITKQLAADAPALAAYIDARMQYGLERRIERQLISGDGTGTNLQGLMTADNFVAHGFTADNMPADSTVLDLIRRCGAVISKLGYTATKLFLNPMDADMLRGMKDKNGNYLMGSPLQAAGEIRPWGLSMVISPEVPEGKFLVGDTTMGATIYDRQKPVIEMFEQDGDNVQRNLYTVRCECRMAFVVETPACFVGGDLAIGPAAAKSAK